MVSLTFKNLMKLIENNPLNDTNNIKYVRHKDTKSDIFNQRLIHYYSHF